MSSFPVPVFPEDSSNRVYIPAENGERSREKE